MERERERERPQALLQLLKIYYDLAARGIAVARRLSVYD